MSFGQLSRTILITGATGFIGSRLATLAMQQSYRVKTLTRSDWITEPAVPVDDRYWGSLPSQIPTEALNGVDMVVHCAAESMAEGRSSFSVNVEGTVRLAQKAIVAGVRTFVFLSSQSARPDAISSYGKTKYAAERALLGMEGLNIIILRLGLVSGPGNRGLYQRMVRMVQSVPVIPLLAGGKSIVQPIHVDDLATAVFRCYERADELDKAILCLGDVEGITLAEFLQAISVGRSARRKVMMPIPLWPVEVAVRVFERLGIPLPINSNNLKGVKTVEKMETHESLSRLGLTLRSLHEAVRPDPPPVHDTLRVRHRATRILLVGAGRVGLVHAITLMRLGNIQLDGVVDPKAGATAMLKGMGLTAPSFRSLSEALTKTRPDAVVIATPVATHLPLVRECLSHGLAVLVEKPLAIRQEQLDDYERILDETGNSLIQVGYVLPLNPQIAFCLEKLKAGGYGRIRRFMGLTLLAFIQEKDTRRWEVRKNMSGGGALINAGGHVLSMIYAAFGEPQSIAAQSARLFSEGVEDSIVVELEYPGFSGTHYCSWSIKGYPRQENSVIVWTDRGQLVLTNSMGTFIPDSGEAEFVHQLDFDMGFNMAPDYAGGGFTAELSNLRMAVLSRLPMPMNIREAIQLERLLFQIYDVARDVKRFEDGGLNTKTPPSKLGDSPRQPSSVDTKRILDLRDLSTDNVRAYLKDTLEPSNWSEYLLTPAQIAKIPKRLSGGDRLRVTVPDFLAQSRLISAGRYVEVLKQLEIAGMVRAGATGLLTAANERGVTLWVAAMALLAAGIGNIARDFRGTILLHAYLTDLALSLRRLDILEIMLTSCRRARPKARIGFHTNLSSEALNALWLLDARVDEVSVLTSPGALGMEARLCEMRRANGQQKVGLTAEVGLAPGAVHRAAFEMPQRWAFGADAVLIGPSADAFLAAQQHSEVSREWSKVFHGLSMPEGVL